MTSSNARREEHPFSSRGPYLTDISSASSIEHSSMTRDMQNDRRTPLANTFTPLHEALDPRSFSDSPHRHDNNDSPPSTPSHSTDRDISPLRSPTHSSSSQRTRHSPQAIFPSPLSQQTVPSTSDVSSSATVGIGPPRYHLDYLHQRYRKLSNRDYYPSPHHQALFSVLEAQEPFAYQRLELVGLNSLDGDIDHPPLYAMPLIIECAILGSPQQRLTLSELRSTLKRRFRHYEKEEESGVKSWERTLLQNLSKKERFVNIERPEPGQGGYWTINHNAPPSNRARKRISRQRPRSPLPRRTHSPELQAKIDLTVHVTSSPEAMGAPQSIQELGGPSSHFPAVQTERLPDGSLKGRHPWSIQLPIVLPKERKDVCPSSPRFWHFHDPHEFRGSSTRYSSPPPSSSFRNAMLDIPFRHREQGGQLI